MIHLVMPMAGRGSRFEGHGAKPYISLNGKPFFYWSAQSVLKFIKPVSLDFVTLKEHNAEALIKEFYPEARVHELPEVTAGAVVTCLEGCRNIKDDYPVVFNDCDHMFSCSEFNREEFGDADGILLTFEASEPKYSFVCKDETGRITGTVEKQAVSSEAICGCYWFKNAAVFREAAEKYLKSCSYSEFFMSGVYNVLIEEGKKVVSMKTDFHVPFGVPAEFEEAKNSEHFRELE